MSLLLSSVIVIVLACLPTAQSVPVAQDLALTLEERNALDLVRVAVADDMKRDDEIIRFEILMV
jgi:hypothetical protein